MLTLHAWSRRHGLVSRTPHVDPPSAHAAWVARTGRGLIGLVTLATDAEASQPTRRESTFHTLLVSRDAHLAHPGAFHVQELPEHLDQRLLSLVGLRTEAWRERERTRKSRGDPTPAVGPVPAVPTGFAPVPPDGSIRDAIRGSLAGQDRFKARVFARRIGLDGPAATRVGTADEFGLEDKDVRAIETWALRIGAASNGWPCFLAARLSSGDEPTADAGWGHGMEPQALALLGKLVMAR